MSRSKFITILVILGCVINAYLAAAYFANPQAVDNQNHAPGNITFPITDGNAGFLLEVHFDLAICFIMLLIGMHVRKEIVSRLICFLSILFASFVYFRWAYLMVLNSELTFPENLANTTRVLDFVSVVLVLILIVHQIVSFAYSKYAAPEGLK